MIKNHRLLIIILTSAIIFNSCSTEPVNTTTSQDGVQIHFEKKGQGEPALVFVHGFASNLTSWVYQFDHFSRKHQVVAVDLAGFGESGNSRVNWTTKAFGADVVSVIKRLKLKRVPGCLQIVWYSFWRISQ